MSNIKVHVEGNPEAVAKFFREMGGQHFVGEAVKETPCYVKHEAEYMGRNPSVHPFPMKPAESDKKTEENNKKIVTVEIVNTAKNQEAQASPKIEALVADAAKNAKKPGRPKKEKAVEPEVVTPDPEFSDLPDVAKTATSGVDEIVEKPSVTRVMVQAALKDYGIWLDQSGTVPRGEIRSYLYALTKKYGNGVLGTPDLEEAYFESVMNAAVNRVPVSELEEYL